MKEKIVHFTFCCFAFLSIFFIFRNNNQVASVILEAVHLFLNKVFVSLFPMFILNDILVAINLPYYFYLIFNPLFKTIFRTSGIGAYVFIMSLISGTPSQAYILKNLVEAHLITLEEANHFLFFTYFSNPLFLVMMLSLLFSTPVVVKIILIHYCSNILIGILIRKKAPKIRESNLIKTYLSIGSVLTTSIKKAVSTLLMILGTIVFYMLLSYILTSIFPMNGILKIMVSGLLEITNGLHLLASITITTKIKEILAITIISFGGLSIHTQMKGILEESDISYSNFLKGRMMQTAIGIFLILLF